ncbi:hypothetical protein C8R44DRAFT_867150 [Mycena epipterygia]|nr:hypothetical protein C8R44DRAFT_867150 [Mycena epipterygia]
MNIWSRTSNNKPAVNPAVNPAIKPTACARKTAEKENEGGTPQLKAKSSMINAEELESKFNVEGVNVIDVVYARQENDRARQVVAEQDARIRAQDATNQKLLRELEALKSHVLNGGDHVASPANGDDRYELEKERAKNAELQRLLNELSNARSASGDPVDKIPRPAGSAGNDFNIQNEMGLGASRANRAIYKSLMRNIRDLTLQAGIDWERPWAETAAAAKAKLFDVARARHPILGDYVNDWATEEIVKQYIKNKHRHAYRQQALDVPEKYTYLKANSAKRNPSASRKRRTGAANAPKRAVAVAAAKKAATSCSKKTKNTGAAAKVSTKTKGKKKVVAASDDEDDSMGEQDDEKELAPASQDDD